MLFQVLESLPRQTTIVSRLMAPRSQTSLSKEVPSSLKMAAVGGVQRSELLKWQPARFIDCLKGMLAGGLNERFAHQPDARGAESDVQRHLRALLQAAGKHEIGEIAAGDLDWILTGDNILSSPFSGVLNACRVRMTRTFGQFGAGRTSASYPSYLFSIITQSCPCGGGSMRALPFASAIRGFAALRSPVTGSKYVAAYRAEVRSARTVTARDAST